MPQIINPTINDTCFYCGSQAFFISVNSKQKRCTEKITQCPGVIQKAKKTRYSNLSMEELSIIMKEKSKLGNEKLKILHQDKDWIQQKSNKISQSIQNRGSHHGENNPMFGNKHSDETKLLLSIKAQIRDPDCYKQATLTKIKLGISTSPDLKTEWNLYKDSVARYTYYNWIHYQHIINPHNLIRGSKIHLDHKFSIFEGFQNNILPSIIGHYQNLELLSSKDNNTKRAKCSHSLDELIKLIHYI